MKKIKIISLLVGLVSLPISFYLQYWIISQLNADRLIWFLYLMHIPAVIFFKIVQDLVEEK